jgi:hypothetical protein
MPGIFILFQHNKIEGKNEKPGELLSTPYDTGGCEINADG